VSTPQILSRYFFFLAGEIPSPSSLAKCVNLTDLLLNNNELTGEHYHVLATRHKQNCFAFALALCVLDLNSEIYQEPIPAELGKLKLLLLHACTARTLLT
jgi:hypothetical protein